MNSAGSYYHRGKRGFPVDLSKAVEMFQRACKLGSAEANNNLGNLYYSGEGVKMDKKMSIHYYQVAAMMGHEVARYKLGYEEEGVGNHERAMRHYMISAKCGHDLSLEMIKNGFRAGFVTKPDFENTLRSHQASQDEAKTENRDSAKEQERNLSDS